MAHMRKIAIPVVVVFTVLVLLTTTVMATSPFVGKWTATDIFDGSQMRLIIKPFGEKFVFQYHDRGASVCGVDEKGNPLYPGIGMGQGVVKENKFDGGMKFYCTQELIFIGKFQIQLEYDARTDTLLDNLGNVWTRAN